VYTVWQVAVNGVLSGLSVVRVRVRVRVRVGWVGELEVGVRVGVAG
jgi:hypothetical protein